VCLWSGLMCHMCITLEDRASSFMS